jgi:hypothetical protein
VEKLSDLGGTGSSSSDDNDDDDSTLPPVCMVVHEWEHLEKPGYKCLEGRKCFACGVPFRKGKRIAGEEGFWPSFRNPAHNCRTCKINMCGPCKKLKDAATPEKKRRD